MRSLFLAAFALAAVPLFSGCDSVDDGGLGSTANLSGTITGASSVQPGCGVFHTYTGTEAGALEIIDGASYVMVFNNATGYYSETIAGYNTQRNSFTIGFRDTSNNITATKGVFISASGVCES